MKKNRTMRVMFVLLALTLLTTCAVSGTFAKYVTSAGAEDSARVAKWGVLVTVEGNAFGTEYKAEDKAYLAADGTISVKAEDKAYVVAPGTSSELLEKNLVATVSGKPEVAVRYALTGKVDSDVVLPKGTYTDYTKLVKAQDGTYGYTGTFTLDKDYAPVKWNLVIAKGETKINVVEALYEAIPDNLITAAENYGLTESGCSFFDAVKILEKVADNETYKGIVETALGKIVSGGRNFQLEVAEDGTFTLSYDFDPNKEMGYTFTLSWEWAFEQKDGQGNLLDLYDKADTYLGNVAAGVIAEEDIPEGVSVKIGAAVTGTATQID